MSDQVSTRVDDRLLGAVDLDHGVSMRTVRADSLTEAERAEAAALLATLSRSWPPVEAPVDPAEHLRWRLASPYGEHPGFVTVLTRDGRLTALEVSTFRPFLVRGRSAVGATITEAGAIPSLKLPAAVGLLEQLGAHFGLRIRDHSDRSPALPGPGTAKAFELGNHVTVRRRILDSHRLAHERAARGESSLPAPLVEASLLWPRAIAAVAGRTAVVTSTVRIERVPHFDERVDEFFVQAARPFELIGVRDAPFLNWRFCDERGGSFMSLVAFEDDVIAGYAVLHLAPERARIADLLTLPNRQDVVAALLRRAAEMARRQGALTIEGWLPSTHPYTETYKRLGFFDTHTGPALTVDERGASNGLDFLRAPDAAIHLALGDGDRI